MLLLNILKDTKEHTQQFVCCWRTSSQMASNDSRKWPGIFVTQSACPDCRGGFNSQSLSGYHLLHAATRKGRRGQAGFHFESLDISFISQITHKHKGEKEPAKWGEQGQGRKRTDTKFGKMITLKHNHNQSCFKLAIHIWKKDIFQLCVRIHKVFCWSPLCLLLGWACCYRWCNWPNCLFKDITCDIKMSRLVLCIQTLSLIFPTKFKTSKIHKLMLHFIWLPVTITSRNTLDNIWEWGWNLANVTKHTMNLRSSL